LEAARGIGTLAGVELFTREWGDGDPVLALHPLGLESSAFEGLGPVLAARGLRVIAVDLPGFGRTPAPDAPLTPTVLAEPVLALARALEPRPALLGISLGGRVALEAALVAPERFRAVVPVAPYLPWRRHRWAFPLANLFSPWLAEKAPVELVWPALRWIADQLVHSPRFAEDDIARAGARMLYYAACPATRRALVSATREAALDPAFGPRGLWTRLPKLAVPAAFVWGLRDRLVPVDFARPVTAALPNARQLFLPCLQHALHGPHARCLAGAVGAALLEPRGAGADPAAVWPCALDAGPAGAPAAPDPARA
jgi:pimeloyl-ACP methyl ester carboxylesterase